MITFEIIAKPIRTLMTVNDIEIVVGTKYPIAEEANVKLLNETGYSGEPFDSFTYRINKDTLNSVNTGICTINFATDKTEDPVLINAVKSLALSTNFFFSSEVLPSPNYDRITITSFSGKGSWFFNGNPIFIGQVLFYYELASNLYFVANDPGVENNYAEINWLTGTILGNHIGVNSLVINTTSDGAELILNDYTTEPVIEAGIEKYTYYFSIKKGISSAVYEIDFDTTNFPDIGGDEKVEIYERELPVELIETLGITTRSSSLDANGETTYVVYVHKLATTIIENNVIVTLKEVDLLPANVNPLAETITLIIPITPTP